MAEAEAEANEYEELATKTLGHLDRAGIDVEANVERPKKRERPRFVSGTEHHPRRAVAPAIEVEEIRRRRKQDDDMSELMNEIMNDMVQVETARGAQRRWPRRKPRRTPPSPTPPAGRVAEGRSRTRARNPVATEKNFINALNIIVLFGVVRSLVARGVPRSSSARASTGREMNDGKSTVSIGASRLFETFVFRRRSQSSVGPMRFLSPFPLRGGGGIKSRECSLERAASSRFLSPRRGTAAREDARARLVSGSRACHVGERIVCGFGWPRRSQAPRARRRSPPARVGRSC